MPDCIEIIRALLLRVILAILTLSKFQHCHQSIRGAYRRLAILLHPDICSWQNIRCSCPLFHFILKQYKSRGLEELGQCTIKGFPLAYSFLEPSPFVSTFLHYFCKLLLRLLLNFCCFASSTQELDDAIWCWKCSTAAFSLAILFLCA